MPLLALRKGLDALQKHRRTELRDRNEEWQHMDCQRNRLGCTSLREKPLFVVRTVRQAMAR
jgi:hypothetical protein